MKTLLSFRVCVLAVVPFLCGGPKARANISVVSSISFGNVSITASGNAAASTLQTSAFTQAGANTDYNAGGASSATSSDEPVSGALARGAANAYPYPTPAPQFSSSASVTIPDETSGFDTSTARASENGVLTVSGSGSVSVTFSATITGSLTLSSDLYGVSGQGEEDFSLCLNGTPYLFQDQILSIAPGQNASGSVSETVTTTMTLTGGSYNVWIESDAEAMAVSSSVAAVPEPPAGPVLAGCLALLLLVVSFVRQHRAMLAANARLVLLLGAATLGLAAPARATYIGSDAPDICKTCGGQPTRQTGGTVNTSLTEGNIREDYTVVTVRSAYGPTLPLTLTYNSYNADGSRAQLDTGLGFGWTHTYNSLLFQQRGQLFRLGSDGRVTRYYQSATGTTYTSDTGYFETVTYSGGNYLVTDKYQTSWLYGPVVGSPFLVGGPVFQLLQTKDRNGNVTTMAYNSSGLLSTVTDPFVRTIQFTYDTHHHLTSIQDPLGRMTQFQYDLQNRMPMQITDPMGNVTQYTYDSQYQMTGKIDRDGRAYYYLYKYERPFAVADGGMQPWFSLANPTNWAVDLTNLTFTLRRNYYPNTTTSTDGNGNAWQYAYDTNGYITHATAPDGTTTRYAYDPSTLKIASITNGNGYITTYKYDANGNRTSMTDPLGNVTTFTYNPTFNLMASLTDPNSRVTQWAYDSNGNQITETDALGQTRRWTYDAHGNVLSYTDKRGLQTQYLYDAKGNLTRMTDPLSHTTQYIYDSIGNLTSITDANGHTTQYTYDSDDRVIKVTDPLLYTTNITYDANGDVITKTDANGHSYTNAYDLRDRLVDTTNALQGVTKTTYDLNDNMISRTDPDGHATTYVYDTLDRQIQIIDPLGNTTQTTYDGDGNALTVTDPNNKTTDYTYDALDRRIMATDPLGDTTSYGYANSGGMQCCGPTGGSSLITGMTNGDGNITYYFYDALNRRTQVERKSGGTTTNITAFDAVTTTAYDADNNAIAVTDPNGTTTTYTYDGDNRIIGMTNGAGDVTINAYDAVGNRVQTTDPRGNVTVTDYDADSRLIQQVDSVGQVATNEYDGVGNVIATADGDGNVTRSTYDSLNRCVTQTDPLGQTTSTAYDADGNVVSTTDRNGKTTQYAYDKDNRQITMTDALGHTSTTAYDADGNLTMITDPLGRTTTNSYDADNRLIQETYPDSPSDTRTYQYDAVGNLTSRTDQLGQTTTYTYNDFYYLMKRDYSVGPSDQFAYDLGGRMTNATRNGWTDAFTYDGANRVLTADQNGKTVTYTYDIPHGFRTVTYPGGTNITESYDPRSRLIEINDGASPPLTQYIYDFDNNVLSRANRNDTSTFYTYNANEWITDVLHTNTTTDSLIAGFAYAYDHEGNRTFQSNQAVLSDSETYAYDVLYRLTGYDVGVLSGSVIPPPSTNKTYNLDAVGNWTSYTSNSFTENRTYNSVNELLTINGSPLTYDANGNLTNDGQYSYAYDVENRLIYVTNDSTLAVVGQYLYDAVGRRVSVTTNATGPSATTTMFYDGTRIIEEQSGGTTAAVYTYGTFIDEVTTMARGGKIYYYHPNALFNIEALTDPSGAPVERYSYDAYGWPAVLDGSYNPVPPNSWGTPHSAVGNPWLFTSRQLDEESGLYYYRGRHYSPTKGRFLQRDPIDYSGGFNLYEYVHSRPIRLLDPSGLDGPPAPSPIPPGVAGLVVTVLPAGAKVVFAKAYLAWQISDYLYSWLFYWATKDDVERAKKAGEKLDSYVGKDPCGPGQAFDAAEFKKDYDDIKKQIDDSLKSNAGAGGLSIIIGRLEFMANNITRYCKPIAANGKKDCKAMNQDFAKEYCSEPRWGNFSDDMIFWCRKNYQKYQATSPTDCYNKLKWNRPHSRQRNALDCDKFK